MTSPAADAAFTNEPVSEEEQQNSAAAVIQRRWRDYARQRINPAQAEADTLAAAAASPTDDGDHPPPAVTEEELREQLLEHCKSLLGDREHLALTNLGHQRVLSKLLRDRRQHQEEAQPESGAQVVASDAEAKYWHSIQKLRDERLEIESRRSEAEADIQLANTKHEQYIQEAMNYEHNFREYVKEKAKEAVFPRNHKRIPEQRILQFETEEDDLYDQLHEQRIQYIRLRNKAKKLDAVLKEKERLTDGLHLIDFEQLKIENTNLNEKIEERNEDLLKLRKKATTTIHVLTHVKEKLEYVKSENAQLQKQVSELDAELTQLRDRLATCKRNRDTFANDNIRMREKMPMIGSEDLLLDYEVRKKEIENTRIEVVSLTNRHHELMKWIASHQNQLEELQRSAVAAA